VSVPSVSFVMATGVASLTTLTPAFFMHVSRCVEIKLSKARRAFSPRTKSEVSDPNLDSKVTEGREESVMGRHAATR